MMITEPVSSRITPRATGPEPEHDVRFYGATPGAAGFRVRGVVAECEPCLWRVIIDGGHTGADLARLEAQHAGTEDP